MRRVDEKTKNDMEETCQKETQIHLIGHAQAKQIMSHSIAKTRWASESDETEEIVGHRYDEMRGEKRRSRGHWFVPCSERDVRSV